MASLRKSTLLLSILFFFSCGQIDKKDEKMAGIDGVIHSLDSAETIFSAINTNQLQAIEDTVKAHLDFIQRVYQGDMKHTMADPLSKYRSILKLLPDIVERSEKVKSEIARTKSQLTELRLAIESNATKDGVGNKIDNNYVSKVYKEEMDVAGNLLGEMRQISEKALVTNERYQIHFPYAKHIVDSLRTSNAEVSLKISK